MSAMATPIQLSTISVLLFSLLLLISAFPSPSFSALVAPIQKDGTTRQYAVTIYLQTPLRPTNLLLDLGASFSWVDCTQNYNSTTYRNVPCETPLCTVFLHSGACYNTHDGLPAPGNSNNSCALIPENPVSRRYSLEDALVDSLALPTTTARSQLAVIPDFILSCAKTSLLGQFSKTVSGLAGFGRSNFSLPAQVSSAFSSPYVFALCLPGSDKVRGAAVFNTSGPYYFSSGIDLAKSLIYTPLLLNPVDFTLVGYYGYPSDEYFIGVRSVKVNGKPLTLNQTLLTIDERGYGGTRISTVVSYTTLHTSIYTALVDSFAKESAALNLTVATKPVKPFGVCFEANGVPTTAVGPAVPTIDLVMGTENVFWRIFGANSMVRVQRKNINVWCLGFVDGGIKVRTPIVVGGLQLEDNLLQFDVGSKRLGFTSSLLAYRTTCDNVNINAK